MHCVPPTTLPFSSMKWVPKTSTNPSQSCNVGCTDLKHNYSPQQQTSVCKGILSLKNWRKLSISNLSTLFTWCLQLQLNTIQSECECLKGPWYIIELQFEPKSLSVCQCLKFHGCGGSVLIEGYIINLQISYSCGWRLLGELTQMSLLLPCPA